MKKILLSALVVLLIISTFIVSPSGIALAEENEKDEELSSDVNEIINGLDLTELQKLLNELSQSQKDFLGGSDAKQFLLKIISGDAGISYGSVFSFIGGLVGSYALHYAPVILTLLAVAVAYSVLSSMRSKFASESVESIIRFAATGVILAVLLTQVIGVIAAVVDLVKNIQTQINVLFPILLTLMTAIGASASVSVYQPAVLVLASGIINLLTMIAMPALVLSVAFTAIGGLSKGMKLDGLASFFTSVTKWILSTAFFIFLAFLSIQGITASVYDGISIRTTKFALSKYVPIIGGYLSDGFNLIMAGSVLVKNSVGLIGILLLFSTMAPLLFKVIIFNLSLKLASAIAQPIAGQEMSNLIGGTGKNLNLLTAIILGLAFLYFIFMLLVVCTGNLAL